jgi:hypothetical protein
MEATNNTPPADVSRVAVRLPPFWAEQPAVWFAQAEARFSLAGISSEKTKFFHVISHLDHQCAAQMKDIITSPPEQSPYTTLKSELLRRLTTAREHRIPQLITLEEMGDRTLSQFLRDLWNLVPDVPDDFLRNIWSSRLPGNIQAMRAFQPETSLDAADSCEDIASEVAPQPALASVGPPPDSATLWQKIEDLNRQVAALTAERDRLRFNSRNSRPTSRNRRPGSRSRTGEEAASSLCWYHRLFGDRAQNCTQPCAYRQQGTEAADISGGACLNHMNRPPLHYRQKH